jgi:hypothetical protein
LAAWASRTPTILLPVTTIRLCDVHLPSTLRNAQVIACAVRLRFASLHYEVRTLSRRPLRDADPLVPPLDRDLVGCTRAPDTGGRTIPTVRQRRGHAGARRPPARPERMEAA